MELAGVAVVGVPEETGVTVTVPGSLLLVHKDLASACARKLCPQGWFPH